jgi:hypothetical protein
MLRDNAVMRYAFLIRATNKCPHPASPKSDIKHFT